MSYITRLSFALVILLVCFSAGIDLCAAQGAGRSALNKPVSIALDSGGALFIADSDNHIIRRVTLNDGLETVIGTGKPGFSGDGGPAKKAQLNQPSSIAIDGNSNIYIYDKGNRRIRMVNQFEGRIITLLSNNNGNWRSYPRTNSAISASYFSLGEVKQLAVDYAGKNLYFIYEGWSSHTIYRLDLTTARIDEIVNYEKPAYQALRKAYDHQFQFSSIALDNNGNIYATDDPGGFILRININSGSIAVINTDHKDLKKSENRLRNPTAITVDSKDNVYYVENNRVWRINFGENKKDAIAGNGKYGYGGDGELPLEAPLNDPTSLAVDRAGTLFICDTDIHRIRYIDRNGALMIYAD